MFNPNRSLELTWILLLEEWILFGVKMRGTGGIHEDGHILDHIGTRAGCIIRFSPPAITFPRFPWHVCTLLLYLQCKHLNPSPYAARLS